MRVLFIVLYKNLPIKGVKAVYILLPIPEDRLWFFSVEVTGRPATTEVRQSTAPAASVNKHCSESTDRQAGRLADRRTDGRTGRQAGRQAGRQLGRQLGRLAGRQADRQTGRHIDRQTDRQTDRQILKHIGEDACQYNFSIAMPRYWLER